jgi:hypothetical protein
MWISKTLTLTSLHKAVILRRKGRTDLVEGKGRGLLLPSRENENRGKENSPDERNESHYCTDGDRLLLN